MSNYGKPTPLLTVWADRYFRFPMRHDVVLGIVVAIGGWFIQDYLRKRSGLVLTKDSLASFADQLCSASISMAGFVFTALALLISVGENYRAKFQESLAQKGASTAESSKNYHPADGFEAFFVTDLYITVVGAFLWASIELFTAFSMLAIIKFLWSVLPDWLSKASLILSFFLLMGPIIRAVYMVSRVLTMRKPMSTMQR